MKGAITPHLEYYSCSAGVAGLLGAGVGSLGGGTGWLGGGVGSEGATGGSTGSGRGGGVGGSADSWKYFATTGAISSMVELNSFIDFSTMGRTAASRLLRKSSCPPSFRAKIGRPHV